MPILNADKAKKGCVVKRGEAKGYAGIVSALLYGDIIYLSRDVAEVPSPDLWRRILIVLCNRGVLRASDCT